MAATKVCLRLSFEARKSSHLTKTVADAPAIIFRAPRSAQHAAIKPLGRMLAQKIYGMRR
jgi:hypothetical protein